MMNITAANFPNLSPLQLERYAQMESLYRDWNSKINLISRKDIDQFAVRHLLHSLSIAQVVDFKPGTSLMDAGTGGGFPGIPLAVFFPEVHFTLVDSIGKKIKVIQSIAAELKLENVTALNTRFESMTGSFDFVTGRAVSNLPLFISMVKNLVKKNGFNDIPNGVLYLTGGEVDKELKQIRAKSTTWHLTDFFGDDFFISKKLIHLHNFL